MAKGLETSIISVLSLLAAIALDYFIANPFTVSFAGFVLTAGTVAAILKAVKDFIVHRNQQ